MKDIFKVIENNLLYARVKRRKNSGWDSGTAFACQRGKACRADRPLTRGHTLAETGGL